MRGDTGGLLFRNQGRLSEIQREGRGQTANLKGELAFRTTIHAYDNPDLAAEAGYETGTSIFDPVLVELSVRWFCPEGGMILDPFAGGSVRGIVSSKLGRSYLGIDLSERQIASNEQQASDICSDPMPLWRVGDSRYIVELADDFKADMLLTCPPYGNLEVYSDDPADLSTMSYKDFIAGFREVVAGSLSLLNNDRFAVIVVGDFRDKDGCLNNFPGDTVTAFLDAGVRLYNEMILVTAVGSLPIRAGRAFEANRKIGKTHQNMYVFVKGDPKRAAAACGSNE